MKFRIIKPCKSIPAYEAIPGRNLRISLKKAAGKLCESGYSVTDASVFLIVSKECEVTIYPSARLLIKTADENAAKRVAEEIYHVLGVLEKAVR